MENNKRAETERALRAEQAEVERALREHASTIDHLSRAAAENYDVTRAVVEHVVKSIADAVGQVAEVVVADLDSDLDGLIEWESRRAPHTKTLDLRDKVVEAARKVTVPSVFKLEVTNILRVRDKGHGTPDVFTGLALFLELPAVDMDSTIVVNLEKAK